MIIETWVFLLIMFVFAAMGFGGLVLACIYGTNREADREFVRELIAENKKLTRALAHRNAVDNINTANEYYESTKGRVKK